MLKRIALVGALALAPTLSMAADAPPPGPPQFVLTVAPDELALLGRALSELPFKDVTALMNKLNIEIAAQTAPKAAPPKEDPKAPDPAPAAAPPAATPLPQPKPPGADGSGKSGAPPSQ